MSDIEIDEVIIALERHLVIRPREKEVLRFRLLGGFTLQGTGDKIGVTPARVRQLESSIVKKIQWLNLKDLLTDDLKDRLSRFINK